MFIEAFIDQLIYENRFSPHTIVAYRHEVSRFNRFLEDIDVAPAAVESKHLRTFFADMLEGGRTPVSVNRSISAIRTYYRFLQREQYVQSNPVMQIRATKSPKKLPVVIDKHKLSALLDAPDVFPDNFDGRRDNMVLDLLFCTGIRLSELLAIEEAHLDFYSNQVLIFGKRNKQRLLPLVKPLVVKLKAYILERNSLPIAIHSNKLIITSKGKAAYPSLIYQTVHKYINLISLQQKKSPHVLRHTFATALLDNGADLNAIKELLGHANLSATQVYTHNSAERLKAIYKQAHPKA